MEKIKKDKEMLKEDISEVRLGNIQCTITIHVHVLHVHY